MIRNFFETSPLLPYAPVCKIA